MQLFKKLLGKKAVNKGIVALSFTPDGIAIAISHYTDNNPALTHCEFIATNNKQSTLEELSKQHHLEKYDCTLVLSSENYRLITIETPQVKEEELTDAIRWKIAELIEFPIEDAVIDFYPLPDSQRSTTTNMLEVVATQKSTIQPLVDLCLQCNLQLSIIDIQETTLRNLAALIPENERGVAVLHLQKTTGRIIIERQGSLYLSRKLAIGFDRLGINNNFLSAEQISMEHDGLALDIQRSFDYVESFYGLPPISGLAVIPLPENTQDLLNTLNHNHGVTARIMDLSTIINGDILMDDGTQSFCATVIGATMRESINSL